MCVCDLKWRQTFRKRVSAKKIHLESSEIEWEGGWGSRSAVVGQVAQCRQSNSSIVLVSNASFGGTITRRLFGYFWGTFGLWPRSDFIFIRAHCPATECPMHFFHCFRCFFFGQPLYLKHECAPEKRIYGKTQISFSVSSRVLRCVQWNVKIFLSFSGFSFVCFHNIVWRTKWFSEFVPSPGWSKPDNFSSFSFGISRCCTFVSSVHRFDGM